MAYNIYCVGAEIGVLTRICGIDGMVIACCYEQFSNLSPIGQSIYTLSGAKIQKKSDFTPFRGQLEGRRPFYARGRRPFYTRHDKRGSVLLRTSSSRASSLSRTSRTSNSSSKKNPLEELEKLELLEELENLTSKDQRLISNV